ncbi:hypothetical protein LH20_05935 [Sphingopyxis sp. 113P3]|nr:hypothetical protein LH20_05935 [Sphingopyxis sp. 113P3]
MMMRFAKQYLAAAVAVVLLPVPAQAETAAEIDALLKDIHEKDIESFNYCALDNDNEVSKLCGQNAGAVVCDLHAIMIIADGSGLARRYASDVADLTRIVGRNADYLNELIDHGYMEDTGKMSNRTLRQYCQRIQAVAIP